MALASRKASLEGIQVLRALAALLVVAHHTFEESNVIAHSHIPDWLTTSGAAGVDIFFVISGFIMFYVTFPGGRPAASPAAFLLKRITRIYPLYWFWMAVVLVLGGLGLLSMQRPDANVLLRSIFLFPSKRSIVGVAWTLVYEMYFYVVFGATLKLRSPYVSLIGASEAIVALYVLGVSSGNATMHLFLGNAIALEFCFGLLLAYLFLRWPRLGRAARLLWIPGFVLLAAAPVLVPHANTNGLPSPARVWAWGLPAILIVASFLSLNPNGTRLRRSMVLLGDASYAIYLTHPLFMDAYARLLKHGTLANLPLGPVIPIVIVASAGFGVLVHVFVERKLLRIARTLVVPRIMRGLRVAETGRPPSNALMAGDFPS